MTISLLPQIEELEGLLLVQFPARSDVDISSIEYVYHQYLKNRHPTPVLFSAKRLSSIDTLVLDRLASHDYSSVIKSMAFVLESDLAPTLAHSITTLLSTCYPVRVFNTNEQAQAWLVTPVTNIEFSQLTA